MDRPITYGELFARMRMPASVEFDDPRWWRPIGMEIDRLRAALKPFSAHPQFQAPDDWPVTVIDRNEPTGDPVAGVTAGDFRRAAEAMTPKSPD